MAAQANALQGQQQVVQVAQGAAPQGGVVQYSFYSSSSGQNGCTETVEWRSDGSGKEPQVVRASSGNCDSIQRSDKPIPTAEVVQPARPAPSKPAAEKDQTHLLPGRST